MNRCEIKGNKEKETAGIILFKSDAIIKDSKIHNLKMGAIHVFGDESNIIKITNNKILYS